MKNKRFKYSEEAMTQALQAVKSGMTIYAASKRFEVPRTTLLYKHTGKSPISRRMGPSTILSSEEEQILVNWVFDITAAGFLATKKQLIDSVQILLKNSKRENPFVDGRPGRHWYEAFLKRHPELSEIVNRASVTEDNIKNWFTEVTTYLKHRNVMDVMIDPRRIFSCDESAFFLSPKEDKVLVKRGDKTVHNFIINDEEECLTTLIMGNASGMLPPPLILFSYKIIPVRIIRSMPKNWGVGQSDSGWMTGETLFDYIANIFFPWVETQKIPLPIVLFVDSHSSHLTLALSEFCSAHQIELIALYPNYTNLIHPIDVAVLIPLKAAWKEEVHNWKNEDKGSKVQREHFGGIFEKALDRIDWIDVLSNGFRHCELYPFGSEDISLSKIFKTSVENIPDDTIDPIKMDLSCIESHSVENFLDDTIEDIDPIKTDLSYIESPSDVNATEDTIKNIDRIKKHLSFIESQIDDQLLIKFKRCPTDTWNGELENKALYYFWKKIENSVDCVQNSNYENPEIKTESGLDESFGYYREF